ncbi:MAG TPA: class I SAM-dependent methyltransferase [Acidimicrobiia bacterium]|jgi:ubiquinone/menaquinone biosynthesis C-methylase UbiE|nr:class I SAM-dependent methyltransferase [Acidimicrobiia bacterium]
MAELPDEIRRHYAEDFDEDARIRNGLSELELVRTQGILRRHLGSGPLRIADVGGATGVHSEWLLEDGHEVVLIEPVPEQVDRAKERLGSQERFTATVGNALALPLESDSCDAVLLMGPLYHLVERSDRVAAFGEAVRVAKPGGLVAAAAISRFASLLDGLAREFLFDDAFDEIVRRDLATGVHQNPERRSAWFTTAYFHHPNELAEEASTAGLVGVEVLAVEGPVGLFGNLDHRWHNAADREVMLEATATVEAEPALLGASPHLLLLGYTPTGD